MQPILIELAPDAHKIKMLDKLFTGPVRLMKAMEKEKPCLDSIRIAKEFVMKRRQYLFANIERQDWGIYFEFLVDFLNKNHMKKPSSALSIPTVTGCSISKDHKVYIPLDHLRLLDVVSEERVRWAKTYLARNKLSYETRFDLLKIGKVYYCRIYPYRKSNALKSKGPNYSFKKFWHALARINLERSRAYSRIDFDALQGRPVQGGGVG